VELLVVVEEVLVELEVDCVVEVEVVIESAAS